MVHRPLELAFANTNPEVVENTTALRDANRTRAALRLVTVRTSDDEGPARLRDLSEGGMMLRLNLPVYLNEDVSVCLSDDRRVAAKVVWTDGENCGLQFTSAIHSGALLTGTAERTRDRPTRPCPLPASVGGGAYIQGDIHRGRLKDVFQRDAKTERQFTFTEGIAIKVTLESGLERRGVVRWSSGNVAGIQFVEPVGSYDPEPSRRL